MDSAEARRQARLRTRKLLAFVVLPEQTAQLTAFRDTWRAELRARGEADYARFDMQTTNFLRRCRHVLFWSTSTRQWGYSPVGVVSPYAQDWFGMLETDHSLGSRDGPNLWLDRFRRAIYDFVSAFAAVKDHAQMRRLRAGAREAVEEELVRLFNSLKAEFAALYALAKWDPGVPIPDTSRTGRDARSKWYTNGGTFGVWSGGRQRLLSDPQGVQAQVRGPDGGAQSEFLTQLDAVGRGLASMPGDFGDLEARTEAKLAGMGRRQREAILEGVGEGEELFTRG